MHGCRHLVPALIRTGGDLANCCINIPQDAHGVLDAALVLRAAEVRHLPDHCCRLIPSMKIRRLLLLFQYCCHGIAIVQLSHYCCRWLTPTFVLLTPTFVLLRVPRSCTAEMCRYYVQLAIFDFIVNQISPMWVLSTLETCQVFLCSIYAEKILCEIATSNSDSCLIPLLYVAGKVCVELGKTTPRGEGNFNFTINFNGYVCP